MKIPRPLGIAFLFATVIPCWAEPTQDEVDAAKRSQAVAEARKAEAEADAATARAKLGTLDLSKLEAPTAEAKTLNVESNILAYTALEKVADALAKRIGSALKDKTVVIHTEREFKILEQYQSFAANLRAVVNDSVALTMPAITSMKPCTTPVDEEETGGGGLGVLGSIDAAAQILSLFKSYKNLEGTEVTVDTFALAATVGAKLKAAGSGSVVYPPLFIAGAAMRNAAVPSDIEKALDAVRVQSSRMDKLLVDAAKEKAALDQRKSADKKPSAACKKAYEADAVSLAALTGRTQIIKGRAEQYVAALSTPDEKTGSTVLQSLVAAEAMRAKMNSAHLLQLKPVAAGGTTLTKRSLFSSSFKHSGGAVVAYFLVDPQGSIVDSAVLSKYGGQVEAAELNEALEKIR